ncbi:MAG: hypothetical protein EB103_04140 [Actinobacteria bacterium]|nr:hypothetical protein [Actinomycetota bacterium]
MKAVASFLLALFGFTGVLVSPAHGDDYYYWPEYGSFASHNDWGFRQVKAAQAHQLAATGQGIKIAILDDGLASYAPGLASKVVAYKDFLPGQYMRGEHGTMVASTIASDYDASVGIGGVAPNASLMVGRVCYRNGCEWEAMRKGVTWAVEAGAQVISMSIAGSSEPYMHAVFAAAVAKGVVVVTSMGNSGCGPYGNWGLNPYCLVGKTRENTQGGYPIAGLIAVGASNPDGGRVATLGWSSSYGPNHDIMAPGIETSAYDSFAASNGFGGTSSSAPIVAGVAALILQIKPDLTPAQVQAIIQSTATKPIEEKAKVWDECNKDAETQVWSCNNIIDSEFPQQYFTGAGIANAEEAVKLTKRWVANQLLPEPIVSQENKQLTIHWPTGLADVIINSKVVAQNVSSGYVYQGFENQSVAIQISQKGKLSRPNFAMMVDEVSIPKPEIRAKSIYMGDLDINVGDIEPYSSVLWRKSNPWQPDYAEYSAVFQFSDGELVGCRGIKNEYYQETRFTCPSATPRGELSGSLRFIGKDSKLGPASDEISLSGIIRTPTIPVTVTYSDQGQPTFSWDPVPGAGSYLYRYEVDYIQHCSTETSVSPSLGLTQPSVFQIWAFSNSDCSGTRLAELDYISYTVIPPKPAKPTGITVKDVSYEQIEFDVPNRAPDSIWRIYRSDGAMTRIFPGMRFIFQIQPNEDVNGKVFTFRFAQGTQGVYSDSWSELSDPVVASFRKLPSFRLECHQGPARNEIYCGLEAMNGTSATRIEYLDADKGVITAVEYKNEWPKERFRIKKVRGAFYVRVAATLGEPQNRSWLYRRGEDSLIEISQRRIVDQIYQPQ